MKPTVKICVLCENSIVAGELAKQGDYVIHGRLQPTWVHEVCAWKAGVKALIADLWRNLQEKRKQPVSAP
jgi:hypothetical protein